MSNDFKKQLLTESQMIWLEALYESIKRKEVLDERELRIMVNCE